jgi:hypothetical protein
MALLKAERGTTFLCNRCLNNAPFTGQFLVGYPGCDGICNWCGSLAQTVCASEVNEPQVGAYGPFEFSMSVTVEVYRPHVWDVNRYYADLGVATDATRKEIRHRYQAVEGWASDRLTYIVKVLLDPERRAVYDAIQPGDFYFDKYLRRAVEERVLEDSGAWDTDDLPEGESLREDLDRRMDRPVSQAADEVVDKDALSRQTALNQSRWGYYRWRTGCSGESVLGKWRCLLALAAREMGVTPTLRVGLAGHLSGPWTVQPIGHRPVAFLGDGEQPTLEHARGVLLLLEER